MARTCRTGVVNRANRPRGRSTQVHLVIAPGSGEIVSNDEFGDCQLHLEFAAPVPPRGSDQGRGNSGVMFFGRYEIQVLDSFQEPHVRRRPGGRHLRAVPAAGQRLPAAWPVADVRHHLQGAHGSSDGSLTGIAGLRHHAAQRRARSRSPAVDRRDGLSGRGQVHSHTDPKARSCSRTTATRSGSATSGFASSRIPTNRQSPRLQDAPKS